MTKNFDKEIGLWLFIFLAENVSSNLDSCLHELALVFPIEKEILLVVLMLITCRQVILSLFCEVITYEKVS